MDTKSIAEFVAGYQFDMSDEGGVYTPTHHERVMLEDAICSFLSEQGEAAQPAADWRDAEIAALQEAVRKYGNRAAMSFAPPRLQEAIDRAMVASPGIASQAEEGSK